MPLPEDYDGGEGNGYDLKDAQTDDCAWVIIREIQRLNHLNSSKAYIVKSIQNAQIFYSHL